MNIKTKTILTNNILAFFSLSTDIFYSVEKFCLLFNFS